MFSSKTPFWENQMRDKRYPFYRLHGRSGGSKFYLLSIERINMSEQQKIQPLYRIRVKSLDNNILQFRSVKGYEVKDGLIQFLDSKTTKLKTFSVSNVEIEEEKGSLVGQD